MAHSGTRRLGLHQVWPSPEDELSRNTTIDLVAIHGLDTASPRTWVAYQTEGDSSSRLVHWLKDDDMLPAMIPEARIFTYDWNANTVNDAAVEDLLGHGKTLLDKLEQKRYNSSRQRPLIFIASCFGGLVLAKALNTASQRHSEYCDILDSTAGIVFMGTPFRGSKAGKAAEIRVLVASATAGTSCDKLVKDVDGKSGVFDEIVEVFSGLVWKAKIPIRCFYETRKTNVARAILPKLVADMVGSKTSLILVEKNSACLEGSNLLALDVNHAMLNKYRGPDDENFRTVSHCLKTLVREAYQDPAKTAMMNESKNKHWIVPRNVNTKFTGREKLLQSIKNVLLNGNPGGDPTQHKIYVITGMGGIGKSEICLKLANIMKKYFWGVFWIDVSTPETALRDYKAVASLLGSSESDLNNYKLALANCDEPWLLILDNADDPDHDYSEYFPSGVSGNVLLTSRVIDCKDYESVGHYDLEGLEEGNALDLFFKAARLDSNPSTEPKARNIVIDTLRCHTLAIIQAGAYIRNGYCTLEDYPVVLQKSHEHIVRRGRAFRFFSPQQRSRYGSVYDTFEVSASTLESSNREEHMDALCLLNILSTVHYSQLSTLVFRYAWQEAQCHPPDEDEQSKVVKRPELQIENSFVEGTEHMTERALPDDITDTHVWDHLTQWHVGHLPSFISSESGEWDGYRLQRAVNCLCSLSLVSRVTRDGYDLLSTHPLVHSWARDRQSPEQRSLSWVQTGSLIAFAQCDYGLEVFDKPLTAHIQSILDEPMSVLFGRGPKKHISLILLNFAYYLHWQHEYSLLSSLICKFFSHQGTNPNTPTLRFLEFHRLQGICLRELGSVKSAVALLEEVARVGATVYQEGSSILLNTRHGLAQAYLSIGQTEEAVALLRHVVKVERQKFQESDHGLLSSQHELACAYLDSRQTQKAVQLLHHVVAVKKQTLVESNPKLLISQQVLGSAYLQNGQVSEATNLLEHVVNVREKINREENEDLLGSQHELGYAYLATGEVKKAIELLEHVVEVSARTLEESNSSRLASEHELARAYLKNGQISHAIRLFEHVVKTNEHLDEWNKDGLYPQVYLARAYEANDQEDEAMKLWDHVSRVCKEYPPEDPWLREVEEFMYWKYSEERQHETEDESGPEEVDQQSSPVQDHAWSTRLRRKRGSQDTTTEQASKTRRKT